MRKSVCHEVRLGIRLTQAERAALGEIAEFSNQTMSETIRSLLRAEVRVRERHLTPVTSDAACQCSEPQLSKFGGNLCLICDRDVTRRE